MPTPAFPTISSGQVTMYPAARKNIQRVVVKRFCDYSEQRYAKGLTQLNEFDLSFANVKTADKETVRGFVTARFGMFDTGWDLTFDGITYHNCQLKSNRFTARMDTNGLWSFTVSIRTTR